MPVDKAELERRRSSRVAPANQAAVMPRCPIPRPVGLLQHPGAGPPSFRRLAESPAGRDGGHRRVRLRQLNRYLGAPTEIFDQRWFQSRH